jgi:hypothetical protein
VPSKIGIIPSRIKYLHHKDLNHNVFYVTLYLLSLVLLSSK